MKVLIFGGKGQLGKTFCELARIRDIEVVALSKQESNIAEQLDRKLMERIKPDFVLNCAAWTNVVAAQSKPSYAHQINATGARNVAIACREIGTPLVHVSTDYVFSGDNPNYWSETDLTKPMSVYGKSKLAGEQMIREAYGLNSFIVRSAWLYSPWQANFVKNIMKKIINGESNIRVVNDQIGQPTSAVDLSDRLIQLMRLNPSKGTYHISNSGRTSWFDFASKICHLFGKDSEIIQPISSNDIGEGHFRPKNTALCNKKIQSLEVDPMKNWEQAIEKLFPEILKQIELENS